MRKIPTIYQRDPATKLRYVMDDPHPDCAWVFAGEGTPTYKWDGTAVMIDDDGDMWKRREVKADRDAPLGFRQEGEADPGTGKRVGWVRCVRDDPADRWHWEGYADLAERDGGTPIAGTYELVGPKVQGNPHGFFTHQLMRHGHKELTVMPTEFDALAERLQHGVTLGFGFEGVVWHHPDGRMAKIKAKDFPR